MTKLRGLGIRAYTGSDSTVHGDAQPEPKKRKAPLVRYDETRESTPPKGLERIKMGKEDRVKLASDDYHVVRDLPKWPGFTLGAFRPGLIRSHKYLLNHVMPINGVGYLGGQSGTWKTFVAIHVAAAFALDTHFGGKEVKENGATLYLAYEGEHTISERITAEAHRRGICREELPIYVASNDVGDVVTPPPLWGTAEISDIGKLVESMNSKLEKAGKLPIKFVIVDTIVASGAVPEDKENDNTTQASIIRDFKDVAASAGICFMLVHHMGKDGTQGLRGASAQKAGADFVLAITGIRNEQTGETGERFLHVAKSKGKGEGTIGKLDNVDVEIGRDQNGDMKEAMYVTLNMDALYTEEGAQPGSKAKGKGATAARDRQNLIESAVDEIEAITSDQIDSVAKAKRLRRAQYNEVNTTKRDVRAKMRERAKYDDMEQPEKDREDARFRAAWKRVAEGSKFTVKGEDICYPAK